MAFELDLPRQLAKAGWKIKIRDKERLEEPHLTIINGTTAWRVSLRNGEFLDGGRMKDFPKGLFETIQENWDELCQRWDEMYPHNRVPAKESDDDDEEE